MKYQVTGQIKKVHVENLRMAHPEAAWDKERLEPTHVLIQCFGLIRCIINSESGKAKVKAERQVVEIGRPPLLVTVIYAGATSTPQVNNGAGSPAVAVNKPGEGQ